MKSLLRSIACIVVLVAAASLPAAADVGVEGCVLLPGETCEYKSTVAGNIAAVGEWTVQVWWGGVCGAGNPDWTRSSEPHSTYPASEGDNNVGGVAGTWEGSIAAGSCARATVGEGAALVGNLLTEP